ncbi:DUF1573 domain-containing protein [Alistipes sp. An66]|uniref:DUF1573 domain-containing protein n=1 Tax=Alistipes sp. An66 TaxID=1965650 RepID=UPI000B379CA6|nr:DUF1573 domain-containing protein [Alistipes sp. An66]OUN59177.1 hypothetical protein B5G16_06125 [Alistipes sp. An66]
MFPSRYLLRGMLLTAVVAGLAACKPRTAARQLPPAGRIIALTDSVLRNGGSDTIRFGHLGSGEIALSRLRIENRTEKPVVVTSYRTSCGCTSLEFDKQPVPPGGTLPVEITFDSRGEHGWQLKSVELLIAGAPRTFRLLVEADID